LVSPSSLQRLPTSETHSLPIAPRLSQNSVPFAPAVGLLQQIVSFSTPFGGLIWQVLDGVYSLTLNSAEGAPKVAFVGGVAFPVGGGRVLLVLFEGGDTFWMAPELRTYSATLIYEYLKFTS
jgi:hypothetical protein